MVSYDSCLFNFWFCDGLTSFKVGVLNGPKSKSYEPLETYQTGLIRIFEAAMTHLGSGNHTGPKLKTTFASFLLLHSILANLNIISLESKRLENTIILCES